MGMSEAEASSFYAMTNSVPFSDARWLSGSEMRHWVGQAQSHAPALASAPVEDDVAPATFAAAPAGHILIPAPAALPAPGIAFLAALDGVRIHVRGRGFAGAARAVGRARIHRPLPASTFAVAASPGLGQPLPRRTPAPRRRRPNPASPTLTWR
jgi:hypothetical protein